MSPLRPAVACVVLVGLLSAVPVLARPAAPARHAGPAAIRAADLLRDISALAADSMEGRFPGTAGDRRARGYLIRRMEEIGFQPGGPGGGWEQSIPFVGLTTKNFATWSFSGPGRRKASDLVDIPTEVFRWRDDFIGGSGVATPHLSADRAEVVFVGYGIQAPEFHWDDYKGADLKGKVLLIMNNDPDWDPALFAGKKRLYYGRWDYKYESAARQGALAAIIIHTEESAGYGWNVVQRSWAGTQFDLPTTGGPQLAFKAWLTEPCVRRMCALGGKDLDSLIAAARSRDFVPIPLGVTTSFAFDVQADTIRTANVIGILPGTDPALRDQAVIFSAHHDHLGVGEPDSTGDRINHGAVDNASGCAQVLAIGRAFATVPHRRSVIALFVAGEEQGLLGSQYYAEHPTLPLARIVADINFDAGNVLGRTSDVAIIGKGKSDLEDVLAQVASLQKRAVVDEPEPDKGYYYRSDQLSFARVGVPALYFKSGQHYIGHTEEWGRQKEADFRRLCYHQPADRVRPDWDLSGMVEDATLGYLVGAKVADADRLPAWYAGDEFAAARKKTMEADAAK
jgi:hypothetical protein